MKGYRSALCISLSLVCVLLLATAAFAADSQAGTWKQNLAKSKYDPTGLAPKNSTSILDAVERGIKATVDTVDSQGKSIHYTFTAKYDGKDYPVNGDPTRDMVSYKKVDDYTFDATNKKDGKVTTTTHYVYAHDGKSRTLTVTGTNYQGQKVSNTQVYDRQ